MPAKILKKSLLFFLLGLLFPSLVLAELYYYRDENGVLHITNIPMGRPWRPYPPRKFEPQREFDEYFDLAAKYFGLDPTLLRAIAKAESNFNPRAVSPKGALGLMQLMPGTARDYGVRDPFDPEENIFGAAAFLRDLFDEFGDLTLVLAAYNAGPQRVRAYGGVPPFRETRTYIRRVLKFWRLFRSGEGLEILSQNP